MRRVVYVSGSRADYGPARRLLKLLANDPALELSVIVTAMHLDPVHGETWRELESDGLRIAAKVPGRAEGDGLDDMAVSVARYLEGMSRALAELRPDVVLLLGDRGEQLAAAMAAAFQNQTIVHLCGGAVSGSIDDSIRHAITKFSHYHLVPFEEHAKRVLQLGESPETVKVVGMPGGDLSRDVGFTRERVCADYGLPSDRPYLLVVQHPVTQSRDAASAQIVETLEAVISAGLPALLANPNDDAGGREILSVMKLYEQRHPLLRVLPPPASREKFASIMAHAGALVGNSSSALVEAMSVTLPVVNIGERQKGREHLACWVNVPHERARIVEGIRAVLTPEHGARLKAFASAAMHARTEPLILEFVKTLDVSRGRRPKVFHDL